MNKKPNGPSSVPISAAVLPSRGFLPSAPSRAPSAAAGRRPPPPKPASARSPQCSARAATWGAATGGRPGRGRPARCPWSREGSSPTRGGREGLPGLDLGFGMCLSCCFTCGQSQKKRLGCYKSFNTHDAMLMYNNDLIM